MALNSILLNSKESLKVSRNNVLCRIFNGQYFLRVLLPKALDIQRGSAEAVMAGGGMDV